MTGEWTPLIAGLAGALVGVGYLASVHLLQWRKRRQGPPPAGISTSSIQSKTEAAYREAWSIGPDSGQNSARHTVTTSTVEEARTDFEVFRVRAKKIDEECANFAMILRLELEAERLKEEGFRAEPEQLSWDATLLAEKLSQDGEEIAVEDDILPIRLSPTPTICSVSPWTAGKGRRRRIEEAIRLILDCSENRTGV